MFTRKHYQQLAAIVSFINDKELRDVIATREANKLEQENPRFDRWRFFQACKANDLKVETAP